VVHPPKADGIDDFLLNEKEGFQREYGSESQPLPQTSCFPDSASESEAYSAVAGYCTAFDWEHLSEDDFAVAIAAETNAPGSGLAVVKAASQAAWRAKRSNGQ
jgi:hypothetical protein